MIATAQLLPQGAVVKTPVVAGCSSQGPLTTTAGPSTLFGTSPTRNVRGEVEAVTWRRPLTRRLSLSSPETGDPGSPASMTA